METNPPYNQWFRDLVERVVIHRVREILCLPTIPERPIIVSIKARARRLVIHETEPPPPDPEDIMAKSIVITVPSQAKSAVLPGLQFVDPRGNLVTPAPGQVKITANPDVVSVTFEATTPDGDNALVFVPNTAAAEGMTATITVSANETGPDDDLMAVYNVGPVTIMGIDVNPAALVVHEV